MKKLLVFFSVFLSLSFVSCDDNQRQSSVSCKLELIAENSDCLAETLNNRCTFFSCTNSNIRIDIRPFNCIDIDCATLECESIEVFDQQGFVGEMPGVLMDMFVDEERILPAGVFEFDGVEEEVVCDGRFVVN